MKTQLPIQLFAALLTVLAMPAVARACGDYGGLRSYLVAEAELEGSITQGELLIAINPEGSLISKNLMWGTTREYGRFGRKLLPHIDVLGDRVCVATETEICEISLKTGKLLKAYPHTQGRCGAVIVGEHKVFLNNGTNVAIMDMSDGTTLRKINLMPKGMSSRTVTGATARIQHARADNRLYVVRPNTSGLAVVDLHDGRRVRDIHTGTRTLPTDIFHTDGTLFVIDRSTSYGIQHETLTTFNAVTGKQKRSTSLDNLCDKLPATQAMDPTTILGAYRDGILVSVNERLRFFNKKGVLVK
ncbi:MAG TPA: hypothetical protein DEF45_23850 [Rhodopirellula sp.]|nr:hypothetical protein [Rhodopirellula sp.]